MRERVLAASGRLDGPRRTVDGGRSMGGGDLILIEAAREVEGDVGRALGESEIGAPLKRDALRLGAGREAGEELSDGDSLPTPGRNGLDDVPEVGGLDVDDVAGAIGDVDGALGRVVGGAVVARVDEERVKECIAERSSERAVPIDVEEDVKPDEERDGDKPLDPGDETILEGAGDAVDDGERGSEALAEIGVEPVDSVDSGLSDDVRVGGERGGGGLEFLEDLRELRELERSHDFRLLKVKMVIGSC